MGFSNNLYIIVKIQWNQVKKIKSEINFSYTVLVKIYSIFLCKYRAYLVNIEFSLKT